MGAASKTSRDRQEACSRCGGRDLVEVPCDRGPHYRRLICRECQRHVRFVPAPWTIERARAFRMPWGKYRGQRVGDLVGSAEGRSYLHWLARKVDGNAALAASMVLRGSAEESAQ
jgi:uncharacterized protein (DUF3820 family)